MISAPPDPVLDGRPVKRIPLRAAWAARIVMGRGAAEVEAGEKRVELDPADASISRRHVVIKHAAEGWMVTDESRLGTTLNGGPFQQARLVYGDRFRIGAYIFQFNVDHIEWLHSPNAGAVFAERLGFEVKGRKILQGIDLEIKPGEFIGILGGSGQGKSTMMNALCGIRPATSGFVFLNGRPVSEGISGSQPRIGYVPQDDIVHPELVVRDAILFSARLRLRLPAREIDLLVDRTIERLGLGPHAEKRVYQLSGGQRKRVSIATELQTRPDVLFLDEPSSGLDPATEESLMSLLQSLALTGLTVVCTTHVLQRAYLFNRILYVHGGRLVFAGTADQARRYFLLETGEAADSAALERSPLDRIYSLVGNSQESAEAWESKFRSSRFFEKPQRPSTPVASGAEETTDNSRMVPWWRALVVLLKRQGKVLLADPLNLLFILAQALAIGILIGWVGSDLGLAAFLVLIASMWFGCSNGAQQIVSELPIFRREKVCGLGVATYVHSKILFLGIVTLLQTALLSWTVFACSHAIHPRDFDSENFERRLEERMTPPPDPATLEAESMDVFEVVDEKNPVAAATPVAETGAERSEPKKSAADSRFVKLMLTGAARWFDLSNNLLESGREELRDNRGNPLKDGNGEPLLREGKSVWTVVVTALGLRLAAFAAAAVIGVLLGLAISALVRNETQAVMWVPLILIPQILFGGFVVNFPDMTVGARNFSRIMPSAALESIIEVSQLFGAATPFLSNRTKAPLFLTSDGAKETVEWTSGNYRLSQDYDQLSDFNTAWQNLAVYPERLGQHKHETTSIAGTRRKVFRDTVSKRGDVKYLKGTPFFRIGAATTAGWVLIGWFAACYVAILIGLLTKKSE